MPIDHLGKLFIRCEPLPLQARAPVLEEAPRPALALVVPKLAEGFLQNVGRVQALVRRQQQRERSLALQAKVLVACEKRVFLSLDEAPTFAADPRVFGLADLVERLAQMAHDVKLVEQDRRLRRPFARRVAKRLPHVHHRQANAVALLLAQPVVELRHARLRAILPAEPDRPPADQVAHHDTVAMALADRDLIDADRLGPRPARESELGLHVLLLQRLDRIPVELQFLGNVLDRRLPTALAHVMGKALRIERVVRKEIEPLAFHLAATAASHPPDLNLQEDARVATRQIANLPYTPVVPTQMNSPAAPANRFFARRASVMMRAFGSPKTPRTVGWGRKPGNVYVSHRRRCRFDELAIGK